MCKKCGYVGMAGPTYDVIEDVLVYRCLQCGFKWCTDPLDKKLLIKETSE